MRTILNNFNSPKIFVLDASGAFVSVILLSNLYIFNEYFGMPKNVLLIFIGIALVFFLYSAIIHFINPLRWRTYLKIIAILNICYCAFTLYHVFLCFENLTLYGKLYFLGEILVIILLSIYELRIATTTTGFNTK
ncbi:MAG: hypothetical protein MUF45_10915 [Spirosomaceae bacterium]|nr:hypothetical protein [Spirosomataceae bacterium]